MSYELILTEKPSAAQKIAVALDNGKPVKENMNGVPYYIVTHKNQDIVVASAVGHLYGLAEKEKGAWTYPVFDIEWKPAGQSKKGSSHTTKYLTTIKKLAKNATSFTIATDYDIEGEVIGLNVLRYACKQKDASRMKFSTLTKPDIEKAYENKSKTIDWPQAKAGETRHFLDWIYGINLSRALSLSIKHATKRYQILSAGRVQGPALKIIVDKEKDINAFISDPYWQIELDGSVEEGIIQAWHEKDKFWKKPEAEEIMKKVEGQKGEIEKTEARQTQQQPPFPFDLTTLQTEAYRTLKIQPKETLAIAQTLYTEGYMSYPRTSSQKLPKEIEYEKILTALLNQEEFSKGAAFLLGKKVLTPNEGKKEDPAHPAIYPTGIAPHGLAKRTMDLYELIVRRFLATFGDEATRETVKLTIDINQEKFISKGTRTTIPGWHDLYGRFVMLKDEELPKTQKGEQVKVKKITLHDKETKPPKRYTPASIIKELEKRGLGTKATRAQIVDNLFQRGYVNGKTIAATELGIRTMDVLEKYSPEIVDEKFTRDIEEEMDLIRENKLTETQVLDKAKKGLTKLLENFKKKEMEIGTELGEATQETRKALATIGKCPQCENGTLVVKRGKFGAFIACDNYPECKITIGLPKGVRYEATDRLCEHCKFPIIKILKKTSAHDMCINANCPAKQEVNVVAEIEEEKKTCPLCNKGHMILRKSMYGSFYGCSNYPKCKYTEKIDENGKPIVNTTALSKNTDLDKKVKKLPKKKAVKKTTTAKKTVKKTTVKKAVKK